MRLELKVISYCDGPPERPLVATFDESGGEVGREGKCDLVLSDASKAISREHGSIRFENGRFHYVDHSKAGTHFWQRNLVLNEDRCELADGERFRIGDYELEAKIVTAEPAPRALDDVPGTKTNDGGYWANAEPRKPPVLPPLQRLGERPLGDNFRTLASETNESIGYGGFINRPDVPPEHGHFDLPRAEPAPPRTGGGSLDDFDFAQLIEGLDDHSARLTPHDKQAPGEDFPSHLWEGLGDIGIEQGVEKLESASQSASEIYPSEGASGSDHFTPMQFQTAPEPVDRGEAPELDLSLNHLGDREPMDQSFQEPNPQPAPGSQMPPGLRVPAPPSKRLVQKSSEPLVSAPADILLKAFLQGAGLSSDMLDDPAKFEGVMRTAGELFREMVDGLMLALRARTEMKRQARVDITTIKQTDNNPLKFTTSAEDAIKLLLNPDHPGFLEPRRAVREGVSDVLNHQLAMTAGIQASLAAALRRYRPEEFEKAFAEGFVFHKKERCWDAFVKAYPDITSEVQEHLFGDEFAQVYERQIQILRTTKRGNT